MTLLLFTGAIYAQTCSADAGTLEVEPLGEEFCIETGDTVLLQAVPNGDAVVPEGYETLYVLTFSDSLVIIGVNSVPGFLVTDPGTFTIHTLVYNPDSASTDFLDLGVVVPGETKGGDVLAIVTQDSICASLDVAGARFDLEACPAPCEVEAGTMGPASTECSPIENELELKGFLIKAESNGDTTVGEGFVLGYLLTTGEDLRLIDSSLDPVFEIEEPGLYTIHPLVIPEDLDSLASEAIDNLIEANDSLGGVPAVQILEVLESFGVCYSIDVAGAAIEVSEAEIAECETCEASAGFVEEIAVECTEEGLKIIASEAVEGNIPDGFIEGYVLTFTDSLILAGVSTEPVFMVSEAGLYRVHAAVVPADTAAFEALSELIEAGEIQTAVDAIGYALNEGFCFDINVEGTAVEVTEAEVAECQVCLAEAGTLSPGSQECAAGLVELTATPNGDAVVPDGFLQLYALTTGDTLLLVDLDLVPSFSVDTSGLFTIHSLVLPADEELLDAIGDLIEAGVIQTGGDVLAAIEELQICASLDVAGAAFEVSAEEVETCAECPAEAGTMSARPLDPAADCILDSTSVVTLAAIQDEPANIPEGYVQGYILTMGESLMLKAIDTVASFNVTEAGTYKIHSAVAPADTGLFETLTALVESGELTTAVEALALVDSLGICFALDVAGADFEVITCPDAPGSITECTLADWKDEGVDDTDPPYDHALFLMTSPADPENALGINTHEQRFVWVDQGTWTLVGDTAYITGTVVNKVDTSMLIEINFIMYDKMTWEEWSAMDGVYMADNQTEPEVAEANFMDWEYWRISDRSTLTGAGSLEGVNFTIEQWPADKLLQVGVGANDKDGSLGIGCWFQYEGVYNDITLSGMGDLNLDITECEVIETAAVRPETMMTQEVRKNLETQALRRSTYELYPMPANNAFRVQTKELPKEGLYSFSIVNMNGIEVYRNAVAGFDGNQTINVSNLSPGMYILMIREPGNAVVMQRISIR